MLSKHGIRIAKRCHQSFRSISLRNYVDIEKLSKKRSKISTEQHAKSTFIPIKTTSISSKGILTDTIKSPTEKMEQLILDTYHAGKRGNIELVLSQILNSFEKLNGISIRHICLLTHSVAYSMNNNVNLKNSFLELLLPQIVTSAQKMQPLDISMILRSLSEMGLFSKHNADQLAGNYISDFLHRCCLHTSQPSFWSLPSENDPDYSKGIESLMSAYTSILSTISPLLSFHDMHQHKELLKEIQSNVLYPLLQMPHHLSFYHISRILLIMNKSPELDSTSLTSFFKALDAHLSPQRSPSARDVSSAVSALCRLAVPSTANSLSHAVLAGAPWRKAFQTVQHCLPVQGTPRDLAECLNALGILFNSQSAMDFLNKDAFLVRSSAISLVASIPDLGPSLKMNEIALLAGSVAKLRLDGEHVENFVRYLARVVAEKQEFIQSEEEVSTRSLCSLLSSFSRINSSQSDLTENAFPLDHYKGKTGAIVSVSRELERRLDSSWSETIAKKANDKNLIPTLPLNKQGIIVLLKALADLESTDSTQLANKAWRLMKILPGIENEKWNFKDIQDCLAFSEHILKRLGYLDLSDVTVNHFEDESEYTQLVDSNNQKENQSSSSNDNEFLNLELSSQVRALSAMAIVTKAACKAMNSEIPVKNIGEILIHAAMIEKNAGKLAEEVYQRILSSNNNHHYNESRVTSPVLLSAVSANYFMRNSYEMYSAAEGPVALASAKDVVILMQGLELCGCVERRMFDNCWYSVSKRLRELTATQLATLASILAKIRQLYGEKLTSEGRILHIGEELLSRTSKDAFSLLRASDIPSSILLIPSRDSVSLIESLTAAQLRDARLTECLIAELRHHLLQAHPPGSFFSSGNGFKGNHQRRGMLKVPDVIKSLYNIGRLGFLETNVHKDVQRQARLLLSDVCSRLDNDSFHQMHINDFMRLTAVAVLGGNQNSSIRLRHQLAKCSRLFMSESLNVLNGPEKSHWVPILSMMGISLKTDKIQENITGWWKAFIENSSVLPEDDLNTCDFTLRKAMNEKELYNSEIKKQMSKALKPYEREILDIIERTSNELTYDKDGVQQITVPLLMENSSPFTVRMGMALYRHEKDTSLSTSQRMAIEFSVPSDFMKETDGLFIEEAPWIQVRDSLLERQGWKVNRISHQEWDDSACGIDDVADEVVISSRVQMIRKAVLSGGRLRSKGDKFDLLREK